MFTSKNIVVVNGTTHHCRLKQGSKIVLQFKYIIVFIRVSCTLFIMRNKEIHLLNLGWKNPLNISLFIFYIILTIMLYIVWRRWILLGSRNKFFSSLSNIKLNINNIQQSKRKISIFSCYQCSYYSAGTLSSPACTSKFGW